MRPIFQHITTPVDGSTASARGITFAIELARDGGRISFCSVVDPALSYATVNQGAGLDFGSMLEVLDDDAALFCRRAETAAAEYGIVCDTQVMHGPCTDEIQSLAAENGSDAIVIGTHGRSGLSRAVLGSVAEGVVRISDVPVVLVHEGDQLRTGPLAVALDSSPAAQAALDVGIAIAAARGMPSIIIYICNPPDAAYVSARVESAAKRAREHRITTRLVLREGNAADELLAVVREHECCMIVMGTHGRSALARLVLGSVAAAVIERADIPVVTVRGTT